MKLPVFFKGLNMMLLLYAIYGFYRIFIEARYMSNDATMSLKNMLISSLPIYSYYYYTVKGKMDENMIRFFAIAFLFMVFVLYFKEAQSKLDLLGREENTNNVGYDFLALLPFVCFFYRKPMIQYSLLGLLIIMMLLAMKRGAILIGIICAIIMVLTLIRTNSNSSKKTLLVLLVPVFAFVVYYYFNYLYASSDYFALRYERTIEGDASGREDMYPMMLEYLKNNSSVFSILFGEGLDSTYYIFHFLAHNDWFMIAIEFGLIGIICYLYYWRSFFKILSIKNVRNIVFLTLIVIFVSDFLRTLFSFSLFDRTIYESCALGYCLAVRSMNT